jgi:glycerol uptake facilitator-like aquaporin
MDIDKYPNTIILALIGLISFINRFMSRLGVVKNPWKELRYIISMSWVSGMLAVGFGLISYGLGSFNPYVSLGVSIIFGFVESKVAMRIFLRFISKNVAQLGDITNELEESTEEDEDVKVN